MFRRASSFIMPSEADKATRAHEKKIAAEKAAQLKQDKLADRRAKICSAAQQTLPQNAKPASPEIQGFSTPKILSPPLHITETTGETPFKGDKRRNPLNERKLSERQEEGKQLAAISDRYGVNLSEAKVMLAKNPSLNRPTIRRNRTSEGELSFSSHSSVSGGSEHSGSRSPQADSPTMSSPRMIATGPINSGPRSPLASSPIVSSPLAPYGSSPRSPHAHRLASEHQRPDYFHRTSSAGPKTNPVILQSPPVRAQRPKIMHMDSMMSTTSVDTALVRPMSSIQFSSNAIPTRSSYQQQPSSPTLTTFGSLGSPSVYAASTFSPSVPSTYSPQVHYAESLSNTDERSAEELTPRTLFVGRFVDSYRRDDGEEVEEEVEQDKAFNESDLYELAAQVGS